MEWFEKKYWVIWSVAEFVRMYANYLEGAVSSDHKTMVVTTIFHKLLGRQAQQIPLKVHSGSDGNIFSSRFSTRIPNAFPHEGSIVHDTLVRCKI